MVDWQAVDQTMQPDFREITTYLKHLMSMKQMKHMGHNKGCQFIAL